MAILSSVYLLQVEQRNTALVHLLQFRVKICRTVEKFEVQRT